MALIRKNRHHISTYGESIRHVQWENCAIYDITPPDVETFFVKMRDIIEKAYASIGGYLGTSNPKKFLKSAKLLRIITSTTYEESELPNHQDDIMALEVFRMVDGSYKNIALAKNMDINGSGEFARAIIRYDIENYEGWYWAEVSGKVEHLMKKYNGYPIPNIYAEEILNKHGQLELDEDGVHYFRQIGLEDTTKHRKVIYGFKHQELFDRVNNSVLDILGVSMTYADFQKYANVLPDERDLNSHSQKSVTKVLTRVLEQTTDSSVDIVKNAKNYIESIGNAFYEDDINEFPNDVIKCLDLCLKLLRQFGDKYINAITQGEELREMITPLEIHTF